MPLVDAIAAAEADARRVLIVAHGAVGTLLYCHLAGLPIDRRWDQPPNKGGTTGFTLQPRGVQSWWRAIDEELHPA
ncbi:MAG: histidine phosphatase family protein [Rhodoferax sp.]